MSLDSLLVLGGEGSDRPRSTKAVKIYQNAPDSEKPYILTAGWCSGLLAPELRPNKKTRSHAAQMAEYLKEQGIDPNKIHQEPNSLDSIGNYVFCRRILRNCGAESVGIIVDNVELNRSHRTAKWVWGDEFQISMIPVSGEDKYSTFRETIVDYTTMLDHFIHVIGPRRVQKMLGKEPQALEHEWDNYMNRWHPFHATGAQRFLTFYGMGVLATKTAQWVGRQLPQDLRETH